MKLAFISFFFFMRVVFLDFSRITLVLLTLFVLFLNFVMLLMNFSLHTLF